MRFKAGDHEFNVPVLGEQTRMSRSTGAALRVLKCEATATGERGHARAMEVIKAAEVDGAIGLADDGSEDGIWKLTGLAWSYRDDGPIRTVYHYTFDMEEQEVLSIEALALGDFRASPLRLSRNDRGR